MAQVFNRIEMDIRTKIPDIITAVQNDSNSRFLDVFLFDGSTPINLTGHEVRIYCRKPENGGEVFNNGEITEPMNGRCQFPLTDQTLAKVGYVEAQIVIYYQNVQVLQSHPFNINVVQSLISSGSVESSNEYGALVVLYQNLYEAYDLMTTMVQNQGNKGEVSTNRNIETFWQALEYMAKYMDTDLTTLLNQVLSEASVQGVIDRLGNATDTGATATAGTVYAKLNALIARDKHKSLKKFESSVPVKQTNVTVLSVSGAGEFYGMYLKMTNVKAIVDGIEFTALGDSTTANYYKGNLGCTLYGLGETQSSSHNTVLDSIPFKSSLIIKGSTDATNPSAVKVMYALYE